MESWFKLSLTLCVFGFLKEIRPSEPFVYDFLIGPWKNLTDEQITTEIYPVGTYSNMVLLILVFLITDICRYKPLIIVLGLSGIGVYGLLLWTVSIAWTQVVEVLYAMMMAAEVAYYTYIYAKVDKEHYQKVTSHTRAAVLAGRAISGVSSQILVSLDVMDFNQLNYITFAFLVAATLWSLFLPSVKTSVYFHSRTSEIPQSTLQEVQDPEASRNLSGIPSAFNLMKKHFLDAFSQQSVLKWSLWYALSTCGYLQVEDYMQPLYAAVQNSSEAAYNGAVEATLTILGFLAALGAGYLRIDWDSKGELALALFSLIQGVLIAIISQTEYIYLCYSFYVVFGILYHFMVTIASAQIAKKIDEDSYGLVFGINMFLALVFQSILTAAVSTKGIGFHLAARGQYEVYGGYHFVIGLLYLVIGLWTFFAKRRSVENSS